MFVVGLTRLPNAAWIFAAVFLTLSMTGCDGSDGDRGPPGPRGLGAATELNIEITDVQIESPPVVEFRVADQDGIAVTGLDVSNLRFTIAKLDTS